MSTSTQHYSSTQDLLERGQTVWLDFIDRPLLTSGGLRTLIKNNTIRGVTSNPSIFQKALRNDVYDLQIEELSHRFSHPKKIYETLAITDIRAAADELSDIYRHSNGTDGFVSLEISPFLAGDGEETLKETRRLWKWIGKDNVMIKIPASKPSLPTIRQALIEGININVTLIFSLATYKQVVKAYIDALETRLQKGLKIDKIASVASFFVSRIDAKIDHNIDCLQARTRNRQLDEIRNKLGIATALKTYQYFQEFLKSPRFTRLQKHHAQPQKLLWASISPKDPSLDACFYLSRLPLEQTIFTMPPKTLKAFCDHGYTPLNTHLKFEEIPHIIVQAQAYHLDEKYFAPQLFHEGLKQFQTSFDALLKTIEDRQHALTFV